MRSPKLAPALLLAGLVAVTATACDSGEGVELSTTSSVIAGQPSTVDPTTTTVPGEAGSSTTTLVGESVDNYEIVARESAAAGETLYIVIPPGAYTDVDMENFVLDLIENGVATFAAEVFDDGAAVDAFRKPEAERTEEEGQLIAQHHLVSLENGTTLVFRGPFESSGEMVIGS